MRRIIICFVIGLSGFSAVQETVAAETVKFRMMAPIYTDEKGTGLRQPEGVGCGGVSLVVVADTGNGRILQYAVAGNSLTPKASITLSQLPQPIKVQVDAKGGIWVLDGKIRKIARVASSGEFQGYLNLEHSSGGTVVPRNFRIGRDENIYVIDVYSARVLVADLAGKVNREIPFPKGSGIFSDISVDGGNVYMIDSIGKRVYVARKGSDKFSPLSESLEEHLHFPVSLAVDKRGYIYVLDKNGSGIVILGMDGSFRGRHLGMGWKEGFLLYPSQICINDNGELFIADRGNNRVEIFLTAE